jgi:hypothetical protein
MGMRKAMLTAAEFAGAIGVPYPTVALWLRQNKVKGATQLELGGLKVWQIPASSVELYKGQENRPKRGRPKGVAAKKKETKKAKPAK